MRQAVNEVAAVVGFAYWQFFHEPYYPSEGEHDKLP
jgi:hypothetical protein